MYINLFVNITSKAWALPILSHLHQGVAARQAPLLVATGASRGALKQSLEHLIALTLLERNPGHGHPLRPEFRLTPQGVSAAALAHKIHGVCLTKDHDLLRKSWTLPVLAVLNQPRHFTAIKRNLSPITDRALSQSLKSMEIRRWVARSVDDTLRPPRPLYHAINTGGLISEITTPQIKLTN